MRKILYIAIAITVLAFLSLEDRCYALYQWTDEAGQIHISDYPNPNHPRMDRPNRPEIVHPPAVSKSPAVQIKRWQPSKRSLTPPPAMTDQFRVDQKALQQSFEKALTPLANMITIIVMLSFAHIVIFVATLTSIMSSEFQNSVNKILWVFLVLVLPLLGVLLYFFIGRHQRVKQEEYADGMPRRRSRELDM